MDHELNIRQVDSHTKGGCGNNDPTPDERIIQPLAYVSAGLYYDQLCDSVESHESAAGVCQHIISEEAENRPRQALLVLSMSYDAMRRGLPDPIWWLSGSKDILPIFMRAFAAHLSDITVRFLDSLIWETQRR